MSLNKIGMANYLVQAAAADKMAKDYMDNVAEPPSSHMVPAHFSKSALQKFKEVLIDASNSMSPLASKAEATAVLAEVTKEIIKGMAIPGEMLSTQSAKPQTEQILYDKDGVTVISTIKTNHNPASTYKGIVQASPDIGGKWNAYGYHFRHHLEDRLEGYDFPLLHPSQPQYGMIVPYSLTVETLESHKYATQAMMIAANCVMVELGTFNGLICRPFLLEWEYDIQQMVLRFTFQFRTPGYEPEN
jgi:hypothetical protein